MAMFGFTGISGMVGVVRGWFKPRDLFLHDGATMRRVHVSVKAQVLAVAGLSVAGLSGVAGITATAISAPAVSSTIANYAQRTGEVAAMEDRVAALKAEVTAIRKDSQKRAEMLANRQAALASMISGKADPKKLAELLSAESAFTNTGSADVLAVYEPISAEQLAMANTLRSQADARYGKAMAELARLGIDSNRMNNGMGGPYEPVAADAANQKAAEAKVSTQADPQFRALFNSWKRLDTTEQAIGGIPSQRPVQLTTVNSSFGIRSDPFSGGRAMHAGVDMPGPTGTPIYATADGIVGRAGRVGGYGNLIELEHGRGIQTRYGHLSGIAVAAGNKIKRGQLIGYMGSTGRSTGPHLHYEVRIDGRAVNPVPFLQSNDYLVAIQNRSVTPATAMGGPAKAE